MFRKFLFVAVVGVSLAVWSASPTLALERPFTPGRQLPMLVQQGLLVTQVIPGGPASMQGLQAGDIIVGVNGSRVRSLMDLHRLVGQSPWIAQLEVIDCNTGLTDQVVVYPRNGLIGVAVQPVPLDNIGLGRPGVRPIPSWQPMPTPGYPGNLGARPPLLGR